MPDDVGRSLGRVAREVMILVIGILIAFGLDSWWATRQETARRDADLEALATDFSQNRDQLAALVEREGRIAESSARIAAQGDPVLAPDSAEVLMEAVFSSARFEPVMGAYEGIVASGGLTRLGSPDLAGRLAGFSAALDTRYTEGFADALYLSLIHDYEAELGFMVDGSDEIPGEYRSLVGDARFRAAVGLRGVAERDVQRHYQALLRRAEDILSLIGAHAGDAR